MNERLKELQAKRNADERFLSHREEQELLSLQAEEIERLNSVIASLSHYVATQGGHRIIAETIGGR